MVDFLVFRRMLTPILIQILWVLSTLALVLGVVGATSNYENGQIIGFVLSILGIIAIRIFAELVMVVFRINETLTDIKNDIARSLTTPNPPPSQRRPRTGLPARTTLEQNPPPDRSEEHH